MNKNQFKQQLKKLNLNQKETSLMWEIWDMLIEDKVKMNSIPDMIQYADNYYNEKIEDMDESNDEILFGGKFDMCESILMKCYN